MNPIIRGEHMANKIVAAGYTAIAVGVLIWLATYLFSTLPIH